MKLALQLKDYLAAMRGKENHPLCLNLLLQPYGLAASDTRDDGLLAGHVLDQLALEFKAEDWVDPLDVAAACLHLGYDDAEEFLSEGPWLMIQVARSDKTAVPARHLRGGRS